MISDEKLTEIRDRTDIVALVGDYVRLKRAGASFKGLCPFHNEKSPSFTVSPSRQFFHCFGCGASGDAITFVMKLDGRSFPEAARQLAERAGVEIPEEVSSVEAEAERRARAAKERLARVLDVASLYYEEQLVLHPLGGMARDEIAKRAVRGDTAKAFRLGYAPAGWDGLVRHLEQQKLDLRDAEAVGLVVPRKKGDGYYDRFRHRLMFPIQDVHGRVVAFSGRMLPPPPGTDPAKEGEAAAKYVNSPEHPLYKKGEMLFGLYQARVDIRRQGEAILCEGNFDLVALHQAGFPIAVAPLGTAFTLQQAKLLRRFAERVTLMFDSDNAGVKAVAAAHPLLREAGVVARVVTLPRGDDPDTFLRSRGHEALAELLSSAPGIVDHLIDVAADSAGADPPAKAAAIRKLGPVLGVVDNRVEARLYVERVAQKFDVRDVNAVRDLLIRGLREQGRGRSVREERGTPADDGGHIPQKSPIPSEPPQVEADLFGPLFDQPKLFESPIAKSFQELLTSDESRSIFSASKAAVRQERLDASVLVAALEGHPWKAWVERRLAQEMYDAENAERVLQQGLVRLQFFRLQSELTAVKKQTLDANRRGDSEQASILRKRINELHADLAALQGMKR